MLSITATNLPRFMACNGSRLLGEPKCKNSQGDDTARNEGIAAHWCVEQVHSGKFTAEELIDRKAPNGVYITAEMFDHLQEYLGAVRSADIEVDTTFTRTDKWEVRGRADAIQYIESARTLIINDFKYGWRIVEPKDNWTLIWHAIGWIEKHNIRPDTIIFSIYQPRPPHVDGTVRTWSLTGEQITTYAEYIDVILSDPSDQLNTGEHCYKCPKIFTCPARLKAQLNCIDVSEQAFNDEVDSDELSFYLDQLKRAIEVLEQQQTVYKDVALHRVNKGEVVPNYQSVMGLSKTKWKGHATPDLIKSLSGVNVSKEVAVTPAEAKRRGVPEETIKAFTERIQTGLKLVRITANERAKKLLNK